MNKYQEYLICKVRGHVSDGNITGHEYATYYHCKYCGTKYWTTTATRLHEENIPREEQVNE